MNISGAAGTIVAKARRLLLAALLASFPLILPHPPAYGAETEAGAPAIGEPEARDTRTPLTLEKAVNAALAGNPDVAAAGWMVRRAEASYEEARAARWPTVSLTGSYTQRLNDQPLMPVVGPDRPLIVTDNEVGADVSMRLPLFTGGRITSGIEAAGLVTRGAADMNRRTRRELACQVAEVFYGLLAGRKLLGSIAFSLDAMREHRDRVEALIEARKAARVDMLRVEVRITNIEQSLVAEQGRLEVQLRLLANLMGAGGEISLDDLQGDLALTGGSVGRRDALASAYERRSDYSALKSVVAAAEKRVETAESGHWPTVSLTGSYGMRWAPDPTGEGEGTSNPDDVGAVAVVLDVPLFEGGAVVSRVDQAQAQLMIARSRLRSLKLQVGYEVEAALSDCSAYGKRVELMSKSIEKAEESLRIEREKYELGRGSATDVLDAQAALLDTQAGYYGSLALAKAARARLQLAMGGTL